MSFQLKLKLIIDEVHKQEQSVPNVGEGTNRWDHGQRYLARA